MKKLLVLLPFCLFAVMAAAQSTNEKYVKAMEKVLGSLDSIKTADQWLEASNSFERIALKEPAEWLPAYYVAFCQTMAFNLMATPEPMKMELLAKRAEEYINKADALQPNNSEVYVLKNMVSGLFIRINPMVNGQKYGPIAAAQLETAMELDPQNPRAYMQKGATLFFTPAQWGGDKVAGLEWMKKADAKFQTFKPASPLHPSWGKRMNDMLMEMAKK